MTVDTVVSLERGAAASGPVEKLFAADVSLCYQCKRCTAGCPAVEFMDIKPHQLVRLVRMGAADRPVSGEAIWNCVGCYACTTRCPQKVPVAEIIYSLKSQALKQGRTPKRAPVPSFLNAFASTVGRYGRSQEAHMLLQYYLTTDPGGAIKERSTAIKLLRQGRLPLLPHRVRGWKAVTRMLRRGRRSGGDA